MAGLSKAGLCGLAPDGLAAVQAVVDELDETAVRGIAHWLATVGGDRAAKPWA